MAKTLVFVLFLVYFCCGEIVLSSVDGDHFPPNRVKRCLWHRSYGKAASDCHGRDLHYVPSDLSSGIQVLDLSYNRIRELNSDSFSRYTSLEMLFLDDNMIGFIAEDAFDPLQYLEVILLNLNAINEVPKSLFSLPYLRKVDLSENRLTPAGFNSFSEAPLTNQVKWLSLSSSHLKNVPPLQRFIHLEYLNLTGNPLTELDALQFAPLCSLKQVDLGMNYKLLSECDCQLLAKWAAKDGITIYPGEALDCAGSQNVAKNQCVSSNSTLQAQKLRSQCVRAVAEQQQKAYMSKVWMYVGITVLAILGLLFIIIFWVARRRRARTRPVNNNLKNNISNGKAVADGSDSNLLPSNGRGDLILPNTKTNEDRLMV